ncbi:unnamed protein product [Cylindrotheca closterium]|uniref:Cleft lip and palate transmembrane protein 1-like protein n=1 Tax=Cylindrotheca closterium TaxID=2856 RepID=A0AAD2CJS9_9STRA|nr:unnamed protein product [Cylindrotheca closterium]
MAEKSSKATRSIVSTSCVSSVLMGLYVVMACFNLYALMYPLSRIDLTTTPPEGFVNPLWSKEEEIQMKIYLSTKKSFDKSFLINEFGEDENTGVRTTDVHTTMLWSDYMRSASMSKSFLLTTLDCSDNTTCGSDDDPSMRQAISWLDESDKQMLEDKGVISTLSGAGQGIESTSLLLSLYEAIATQMRITPKVSSSVDDRNTAENGGKKGLLERSVIHLPQNSAVWMALVGNSTVYVHVVVARQQYNLIEANTLNEAVSAIGRASNSHSLLLGKVGLVKHDEPNHITKPKRILLDDLVYCVRKYILQDKSQKYPPWDMEHAQPEYYETYSTAQRMKAKHQGYPFFKPEVAIKYLIDEDSYPMNLAHVSGMELVRVGKSQMHPSTVAHIPALHVDEIGLTSEKYIPLNQTISSLPLRVSFDRSDMEEDDYIHRSTATAGGISPARWRLLSHLSQAIESQKEFGFDQSDIDDLRRLIADTNVTLLGITVLASALHLLFEFLTFKNEVSFWRNNKDLTGLSVRSLFLDMVGQFVILLFLIEKESSLLMTIPSACGVLIAMWKCKRASGLSLLKADLSKAASKWNQIPRLFGLEVRATRLENMRNGTENSKRTSKDDLHALTMECDRIATSTLSKFLVPLVVGYALYSFVSEEHSGWYSWFITTASSAVYALGFALMCPQLFLNYKLKSVAHLPWTVLCYKSVNTFIDDLFSFIIRMPTMARISCFRDDIVFFIYLYQRWLYPVDDSRPAEGGDGPNTDTVTESKKDR